MRCFKRRIAGYERKRGARVGDNGSTSYVATHADDHFTCLVPERFLGSLTVVVVAAQESWETIKNEKAKRKSQRGKGRRFTLGMRNEY